MIFMNCVKCDRPVESRKPLGRGHSTERICESCATNVLAFLGLAVDEEQGVKKVGQLELALG